MGRIGTHSLVLFFLLDFGDWAKFPFNYQIMPAWESAGVKYKLTA